MKVRDLLDNSEKTYSALGDFKVEIAVAFEKEAGLVTEELAEFKLDVENRKIVLIPKDISEGLKEIEA